MRFLPHHFQSMEKAAAWYPTSATPTFSRFHSQLVITDASDPTRILQRTHIQVRAGDHLKTGCDVFANADDSKATEILQMTTCSFRVLM